MDDRTCPKCGGSPVQLYMARHPDLPPAVCEQCFESSGVELAPGVWTPCAVDGRRPFSTQVTEGRWVVDFDGGRLGWVQTEPGWWVYVTGVGRIFGGGTFVLGPFQTSGEAVNKANEIRSAGVEMATRALALSLRSWIDFGDHQADGEQLNA